MAAKKETVFVKPRNLADLEQVTPEVTMRVKRRSSASRSATKPSEVKENQLFQWATVYPDGSIGAISEMIPGVGHVPLYARSREMAERMRPIAMHHAIVTQQKVWLRVWTVFKDEPALQVDPDIFAMPIR